MVQRTKRLETKSDAYYENRADAVAISKARGCGGVRTILLAGKKYYAVCNHKAPKRGWENLDEKPISGIATLPGGGLVTGSFSGKSLGRPIGGVAEFDGDSDGFTTGPDGEDNIPAPTKKILKRAKDITDDLKVYFGNYRGFIEVRSEGDKEIKKRTNEYKLAGKQYGDVQLEIIAEKQGFTGKPKVVSSEKMKQLEQEGWTIAYRGIKDVFNADLPGTPDNRLSTSEQLAKQFVEGDYWAGMGHQANGIYFTDDLRTARQYAYINNAMQGTVMRVAIPPNTVTERSEFDEMIEARYSGRKSEFGGDDDIGRLFAAKGHRAALTKDNFFVVWDRSMLAVEEGFVETI
jgi:hypothetical protein